MNRNAALTLAVSLVLVFAACGSPDAEEPLATVGPTTTTALPATTATTEPPTTLPGTTSAAPPTSTTTTTLPPTTTTEPPDVTPPVLVITDPEPGATVDSRTYLFRGTTEPGCTVTAAGRYEADVDATGTWSIVLVLNEGGNLATFVAADQAGNTTSARVAVNYVPTPTTAGTVLVTSESGVYQVDATGQVTDLLTGRVATAVDDTRGGLLFQTHKGRNWDNVEDWSTVIWWVPKGRTTASALLVPDPGSDHQLTLHDSYRTDSGFVVVYTRHEGYTPFEDPPTMHDRLRLYDVDTRHVQDLYRVRGWEWDLAHVSAGNGLITATERQMNGWGCILVDDSGTVITRPGVPTSRDCFTEYDLDCPHSCALCDDASHVAYIDPSQSEPDGDFIVIVRHTATGDEMARRVIPREMQTYPYGLELEGTFLVVNRLSGHPSHPEDYSTALTFDLEDAAGTSRTVPIRGRAHLVHSPVDIGPMALPNG